MAPLFHPTRLTTKFSEGPCESIVPKGTSNRPQMSLFGPRKGAEVPGLNALDLCETRGFSGQFHIKTLFLGAKRIFAGGSEVIWTQ
jgi:hypothetical protein